MPPISQNLGSIFGTPIHHSNIVPRDGAIVINRAGFRAGFYVDELTRQIQAVFGPPAKPKPSANELAFRELDVQAGDLVRLIPRDSRVGAQLEGRVEQIKTVNGGLESQLRIKGFDETPHGSHNVYFGVENHEVEVLERDFRWTEEDRIITVLGSFSDAEWKRWAESTRAYWRRHWASRIAKIKNILA